MKIFKYIIFYNQIIYFLFKTIETFKYFINNNKDYKLQSLKY